MMTVSEMPIPEGRGKLPRVRLAVAAAVPLSSLHLQSLPSQVTPPTVT